MSKEVGPLGDKRPHRKCGACRRGAEGIDCGLRWSSGVALRLACFLWSVLVMTWAWCPRLVAGAVTLGPLLQDPYVGEGGW